jgi:hypothetical protein
MVAKTHAYNLYIQNELKNLSPTLQGLLQPKKGVAQ